MNRVAAERKLINLTQAELASRLDVDPSTVGRWEGGGSIPQDKLIEMRSTFCCDIDWILGVSNRRRTGGVAADMT